MATDLKEGRSLYQMVILLLVVFRQLQDGQLGGEVDVVGSFEFGNLKLVNLKGQRLTKYINKL